MTKQWEILEVPVEHLLDAAQARAEELGELRRSMRGMQASQVGALGELIGMEYFQKIGVPYEEVYSTAYDIRRLDNYHTLEFKTKERTVAPVSTYDCTTPQYNKDHQRPDEYLFISLLSTGKSDDIRRFTKGYILGGVTKEVFNELAVFWRRGQIDPSNGWQVTIDCWNIPVFELDPPIRMEEATV